MAVLRETTTPEFVEVTLKRLVLGQRFELQYPFAMQLDVSAALSPITRAVMVEFRQHVAGQVLFDREVRYPADWWQAFKGRWFPRWLLRRFPVRETVVRMEAKALYPQIAWPAEARLCQSITFPKYSRPR